MIRAHAYLDALIKLYRLPRTIHLSLSTLQERIFVNLEADTIQRLLEKFTEVQQESRADKPRHQAKAVEAALAGAAGEGAPD